MQAVTPPASPDRFKFVLDELTEGLMDAADGPLLAAGNNLWLGLATIIVVWTGLRTAFSGEGFNFWEFVKLIVLLSIPRGMLLFYDTPFPGMTITFPEIIVNQGSWLNGIIVGDTGSEVWTWLQKLYPKLLEHPRRPGHPLLRPRPRHQHLLRSPPDDSPVRARRLRAALARHRPRRLLLHSSSPRSPCPSSPCSGRSSSPG